MKSQSVKIGVFIAIIGIACIILSQTANFNYTKQVLNHWGQGYYPKTQENVALKNGLLYGGIVVLIFGAGVAAFSSSEQNKQ